MSKKLPPIHPGDMLYHEFMEPLGLSSGALARKLGVPANRISSIVNGSRDISPDTALRLSRAFRTSAEMWLNMQSLYNLQQAEDAANKAELNKIDPVVAGQ